MDLYKRTGAFLRAYANLANEMAEAGYCEAEAQVTPCASRLLSWTDPLPTRSGPQGSHGHTHVHLLPHGVEWGWRQLQAAVQQSMTEAPPVR